MKVLLDVLKTALLWAWYGVLILIGVIVCAAFWQWFSVP